MTAIDNRTGFKMNNNQAGFRGFIETIKASILSWLIWEVVWLFYESEGDFANGILFFIQNHLNYRVVAFYTLTFALMLFCGKRVGVDILVSHKRPFLTGVKYAVISFGLVNILLFLFFWNTSIACDGILRQRFLGIDIFIGLLISLNWLIVVNSLFRSFRSNSR